MAGSERILEGLANLYTYVCMAFERRSPTTIRIDTVRGATAK